MVNDLLRGFALPKRKPKGPHCKACGLAYANPGWCDCFIPNEIWAQISPTGNEGGLLCISCIAARLVKAGISGVPLKVTSGPWRFPVETTTSTITYTTGKGQP